MSSPGAAGASAGAVVPVPGWSTVAGEPLAGGGGEVWPNEFNANVSEQRETVSSVFID